MKKEVGAALIVALQLTALTFLSLVSFIGGPQQSTKAPAESQMSAAQTQTGQPSTATALTDRRASAIRATKLYEPRATEIFNLATSRAESAQQSAQQSVQEGEAPNEATLTTDREAPNEHFHGGQPGNHPNP